MPTSLTLDSLLALLRPVLPGLLAGLSLLVVYAWTRRVLRRRDARRMRAALEDGTVTGAVRLTENRRAQLLEHLGTIRASWETLSDQATGLEAVGDAAMLYPQAVWLAEKLEEMLTEHVRVVPSVTVDDQAPAKPLRDRMRVLVSIGKGRGDPTP